MLLLLSSFVILKEDKPRTWTQTLTIERMTDKLSSSRPLLILTKLLDKVIDILGFSPMLLAKCVASILGWSLLTFGMLSPESLHLSLTLTFSSILH